LKYGNILLRECNLSGALACFSTVQIFQPQDWLRLKMALLLPPIVESVDHITILRSRVGQALKVLSAESNLMIRNPPRDGGSLFYAAYYGHDDRHLCEALAALYTRVTPSLTAVAPHCVDGARSDDGGRIKVAFVSAFFFDHSIGRLNKGLIAHLDREIFEVTVVIVPHVIDEMTTAISESVDHSTQVPLDLDKAREIIAQGEFDIIVYPEIGMDIFVYSLAFARLAQVQCVSWGHPVTTGIPNMDYFVSAKALETAKSDGHYSETLIRLKELPTYFLKPEVTPSPNGRADFGLKENVRYYLVAQFLFKLHPEFDKILSGILRRDPEGVVLLVHGRHRVWSQLLKTRFRRAFPDASERVQFVNSRKREDFLAFLACVDVSLDIPHFNGGNTTLEALAVGTPVVTMATDFMRGRVCAAIYRKMGVGSLIAKNPEEYVDLAVRLAKDDRFRDQIKDKIEKKVDRLFENNKVIREWEQFFLKACKRKGARRDHQ
jgi:protein O-GlcNAc transferase